MRLCLTYCGQKVHIIREDAYHGKDGTLLTGLCGAYPKRGSVTDHFNVAMVLRSPRDEVEALAPILCGTCRRIVRQTGSL